MASLWLAMLKIDRGWGGEGKGGSEETSEDAFVTVEAGNENGLDQRPWQQRL